jgi:hypothetical protein
MILEALGSIVMSKQKIFNPKHLKLEEQFPLNLTLNPKPKSDSLCSTPYPFGVQWPEEL